MIKHYVRIWYPSFLFSESSVRPVETRELDVMVEALPKEAYGFRFFDQEEEKRGDEILRGPEKNESPTYYPGGKRLTAAEVEAECGAESIAAGNMRTNEYASVIKHRHGGMIHDDTGVALP